MTASPFFDASKTWIILSPGSLISSGAVKDLSKYIGLIQGPGARPIEIADAAGDAPPAAVSIFVLNLLDGGDPSGGGFSWRAAPSRIEIYGKSPGGLFNGIYDFLSALGISWPAPDFSLSRRGARETAALLPKAAADKSYALKTAGTHEPSAASMGKRFAVPPGCNVKAPFAREALLSWAARNKYGGLVFPFGYWGSGAKVKNMNALQKEAGAFALEIEAGGRELSLLVPRRLFFFHRDIFRMESGKRRMKTHFCPTSPETINVIKKEGVKLFRAAPKVKIFHLWPDSGGERTWCSCPSCRAFSFEEQYRIAINAAADALSGINGEAFISIPESSNGDDETSSGGQGIALRPNVIRTSGFQLF